MADEEIRDDDSQGMKKTPRKAGGSLDPAEIRPYGVEPNFERYTYDPNSCSWCNQPVLIMQSKERSVGGFRSERTACEHCMSRMSKRTKAAEFRWVFLPGWRPE
jgi:hypothetical protein